MSFADTSKRGAALTWRLAVNGIQSASRFKDAFKWRRAFSSGTFMARFFPSNQESAAVQAGRFSPGLGAHWPPARSRSR